MMAKTALITGITGQDGSYLAEFLLDKGYEVYGLIRRRSTDNLIQLRHIINDVNLVQGDLIDLTSLINVLQVVRPRELYNLAAHPRKTTSFSQTVSIGEIDALGVTRILQAIQIVDASIKFYQASSSEMYYGNTSSLLSETTPFRPRSPHGIGKLYAHWTTVNFRESYGLFATSGIMFDHDSPRQSLGYITRKITNTAARIKLDLACELHLGNLDIRREWGFAGDYVEAMWLMLQQDTPSDYVIATGKAHSLRECVEEAFNCVNLDYREFVTGDECTLHPFCSESPAGDATKANNDLGWQPNTGFKDLICMMVDNDLRVLQGYKC